MVEFRVVEPVDIAPESQRKDKDQNAREAGDASLLRCLDAGEQSGLAHSTLPRLMTNFPIIRVIRLAIAYAVLLVAVTQTLSAVL